MICVDTDVLVEFFHEREAATKAIAKHKDHLVTTDITKFEVLVGIHEKKNPRKKELTQAIEFFETIHILPTLTPWAENAAEIAGKLTKQGQAIDDTDCMIASIMKLNGVNTILTGNTKHFTRIPGLKVLAYTRERQPKRRKRGKGGPA